MKVICVIAQLHLEYTTWNKMHQINMQHFNKDWLVTGLANFQVFL